MTRPLYIFDLDVLVCADDKPDKAVISAIDCLLKGGADIYIWSVRSTRLRAAINKWVVKYLSKGGVYLRVRGDCDHTPGKRLKKYWFDSMSDEKRKRFVAVFEKRNKFVAMWRDAGIACFQVAPGAF